MRRLLPLLALLSSACASPGFQLPPAIPAPIAATGEVVRHPAVASAREDILPRHIDVWLPPSYRMSDRRYPVIYANDGNTLFDPALSPISGLDWGVDETLARLIGEGRVPEAIVVALHSTSERYEDYMAEAAIRPLTPAMRARMSQRPVPFSIERMHGDSYLRFLADEVKPAIDRAYRTLPGPAHTTVIGASTGGIGSAYAAVQRPDVFGAGAGLSTHVGSAEGAFVDWLERNPPDPERTRLYFDYGDEGIDAEWNYGPLHRRMDAALREAGYVEGPGYTNRLHPGTGHGELHWSARMADPLLFLLNPRSGDNAPAPE